MMGRQAAFYSPLTSMWGTFGGSAAAAVGNSKSSSQYHHGFSSSSSQQNEDQTNNNKHLDGVGGPDHTTTSSSYPMSGSAADFKPTSDQLMSLSAYGMHHHAPHSNSRKLPEGTAGSASGSGSSVNGATSTGAYPYYHSATQAADLASMYGSAVGAAGSFASSAIRSSFPGSHGSSRPKPKARSNAGKRFGHEIQSAKLANPL